MSDTADAPCQSCGMPIESGAYCGYCADEKGNLHPFEESFERMVEWQARRNPSAPRERLEVETMAYLAMMPAWRDHPRVKAAHTG